MSRWADWIPLSPAVADQLLLAAEEGDEAVMEVIEPLLEQLEELPLRYETDKAWDPIHRCLTDDPDGADLDFEAGEYPLKLCVLGGKPLLQEGYRSAALIPAADVPAVAAALAEVTQGWLRERFFALPDTQFYNIGEVEFDWVWSEFEDLPRFFADAAASGLALVCTISH